MSSPKGQILPGSRFGDALTRCAINAETIVEIGTWWGEGSTRCLANGLVRPSQRMWSIDQSKDCIEAAKKQYQDPRITFLHGVVITPDEMDETRMPASEPYRTLWRWEREGLRKYPLVIDLLPVSIDLALFDGGEYSGHFDYVKLNKRAKVVALDDCRNHDGGMEPSRKYHDIWQECKREERTSKTVVTLFEDMNERNGWYIYSNINAL